MNEKNSFVYFKKISEQTYFDCFKKKFVSEEPADEFHGRRAGTRCGRLHNRCEGDL